MWFSLAQFALRWILDHKAVTTIIVGASKLYQVESNVAASSFQPLDESIHTTLSELYEKEISADIHGVY